MGMSSNPPYPVGTVITGKWRGNRYVVERMLGKGANGTVYLVQREGRREKYALKVGNDTLELQSEINVLTTLQSCRKRSEHRARRESPLSSYLLESDDFKDGVNEPFYVMRYVEEDRCIIFSPGTAHPGLGWSVSGYWRSWRSCMNAALSSAI